MSQLTQANTKRKKSTNLLLRNQLIGGICACLVILFACIRIFVLNGSADNVLTSLISVSNAVLSLVVLTSAVRIMLSSKKHRSFEDVLIEQCEEIDRQYGALIEAVGRPINDGSGVSGMVYSIADNVDAIFTPSLEQWDSLQYMEKFAFSPDFVQTRKIVFYVNHADMKARAERKGDDLATTARLLARDIAVAIQRSFSDILTAHALEVTQEEGRALVTILVNSTETAEDAERIGELIDYLLFLHFVAT